MESNSLVAIRWTQFMEVYIIITLKGREGKVINVTQGRDEI